VFFPLGRKWWFQNHRAAIANAGGNLQKEKVKPANKQPSKLFVGVFMLGSIAMVIFAAISKKADISAVAQAIGFALAVAFIIGGLYAILYWLQHKKILKNPTFAEVQAKERGGWLAAMLALFVAFAVSKWTFVLLEYFVVCHIYGRDAWLHGLRVVPAGARHGVFSNGDALSGWPALILNFGTFIAIAVFGLGSFLLFRYIGFRLRGRRFNNP
jgi:hypothetical protein